MCGDYGFMGHTLFEYSIPRQMHRLLRRRRRRTTTTVMTLTLGLSNAGFPFFSAIVLIRRVSLS